MNIIPTIMLAALAGLSTLAQAQSDLPAAVGRISAVQGQVTLSGDDEPVAASPYRVSDRLHGGAAR